MKNRRLLCAAAGASIGAAGLLAGSGAAHAGLVAQFTDGGIESVEIFDALVAADTNNDGFINSSDTGQDAGTNLVVPETSDDVILLAKDETSPGTASTNGSFVTVDADLNTFTYDLSDTSGQIVVLKAANDVYIFSDQNGSGTDQTFMLSDFGETMDISNAGIWAVPLPAAAILFLTALGGLYGVRRWQGSSDTEAMPA